MKKLLVIPFFALTLAGCGDSIPSECETTLKLLDQMVTTVSSHPQVPDQMKEQMKTQMGEARKQLQAQIKEKGKDDAIKACKLANTQFEQMQKMLPK